MKKVLFLISICIFYSCSSIPYYNQSEFILNYNFAVKNFKELLKERVTNTKLKKVEREFNTLYRQLYEKNENYERINEETVIEYTNKIKKYKSLIKDLKD